jgi:hypothetical protein
MVKNFLMIKIFSCKRRNVSAKYFDFPISKVSKCNCEVRDDG